MEGYQTQSRASMEYQEKMEDKGKGCACSFTRLISLLLLYQEQDTGGALLEKVVDPREVL